MEVRNEKKSCGFLDRARYLCHTRCQDRTSYLLVGHHRERRLLRDRRAHGKFAHATRSHRPLVFYDGISHSFGPQIVFPPSLLSIVGVAFFQKSGTGRALELAVAALVQQVEEQGGHEAADVHTRVELLALRGDAGDLREKKSWFRGGFQAPFPPSQQAVLNPIILSSEPR